MASKAKAQPKKDLELPPKVEGIMRVEDLIREVGDVCDIPYWKAKKVVFAMLHTMIQGIRRKEDVRVQGFGTFFTKWWKEATVFAVNLGGGTRKIPGHFRVRFYPHKQLKYKVNPHLYEESE